MEIMTDNALPGGTFKLTDDIIVNRMGYGAMQLAGPGVFGPPKDHDKAIAVLHEVIQMGITQAEKKGAAKALKELKQLLELNF